MSDLLGEILPPVPEGNPGDIVQRSREYRIQEAIDAQPPVSRAPLVPWPATATFQRCLGSFDYHGLSRLAESLPVIDQHYLLRRLGEEMSREEAASWADSEPTNPLAQLAHAATLQHTAWQHRGPDLSETTGHLTDSTFDTMSFDTYLVWSRELCEKAAALMPKDQIVAWVLAQRSVPTSGATRDDVLEAAKKWQVDDPLDYFGLTAMVAELSPKWLGQGDDCLDFARQAHRQAPDGHPSHAVIPIALTELFVAIGAATQTVTEAADVFRQHKSLLEAAYRRCLGSELWRSSFLDGAVRNLFCFALFNADSDELAWQEMQALHGHVLQHPWSLRYGDGLDAFDDARAWLIKHVAEKDD